MNLTDEELLGQMARQGLSAPHTSRGPTEVRLERRQVVRLVELARQGLSKEGWVSPEELERRCDDVRMSNVATEEALHNLARRYERLCQMRNRSQNKEGGKQ